MMIHTAARTAQAEPSTNYSWVERREAEALATRTAAHVAQGQHLPEWVAGAYLPGQMPARYNRLHH
jgi:hypothetical protein